MTLDIRGSLKNTKLSHHPYVVFEELISNAIDSFLIRKSEEPTAPSMSIDIHVDFPPYDLIGELEDMSIRCRDNGCGLGEDQLQAFLTKDTSYKDDLSISGIGKCKGAGRIQFFHHFSSISIDSTYRGSDCYFRRQMTYVEPTKQIDEADFQKSPGFAEEVGTTIALQNFREVVRQKIARGERLSSLFSASILKKQMLVTFLQRLISLDARLGDFEIYFSTRDSAGTEEQSFLRRSDLPVVAAERIVYVEEHDASTNAALGNYQSFKLSHYKLEADHYGLPRNAIALCAKSSPVRDITARYLRTRSEQNNPVAGFHHIVLVESDFFDQQVNEQRDDFDNIPEELPLEDMFFTGMLSYANIYDAIDPVIEELVTPADWRKEVILREVIDDFGISEAMLQDTSTRVVYGESARSVAERVLKKYQERVIDDTAEIIDLKRGILEVEPDSELFRSRVNELAWKYTSSLKNFDMASLSQLIVRRAAIVQILDLACSKRLLIQVPVENVRRKDERLIHSIFFPMRKDSDEVSDHDIWLLSEEYHYYDYIASDLPLAEIEWSNGGKVFDSDIDDSLEDLLKRRATQNGAKRPDIALFTEEGSAVIVEFKAPGVSMDEHVGDLTEYAHLLAAKSKGRLKKFYGYLVGDTVNALRLNSWTPFPTGKGWFQSSPLQDPVTRQLLGETYFEILHFSDVIDRAKKRIGVYREKLRFNLELPHIERTPDH